MKFLPKFKSGIGLVVLLSCVFCGGMAAGLKPALAALQPLAAETCTVTWVMERRPAGLRVGIELDCQPLLRRGLLWRLYLNPVDHKW